MAEETTVKGVTGEDQNSLENDRSKAKEQEKLLKEKLLDEKMKLIRQKNEERLRRQKEIEEDIKYASLHSNQVAEEKPVEGTPAVTEHKMAGVQKINSSPTRMRGRARGRILAKMAKEELYAHRFEDNRKQNYKDVENELQEEKKRDSSPREGSSSFLSDERRVDMSKVSSRSLHSWGGSQFEDVVEKVHKDKHARPRGENQNIEVSMTGKERKQYLEWKEERNRIDGERKLRQKRGENWKREWDREKGHREASFTHARHDQRHTRRSGQRFGERTRQKPDWDLHDDRFQGRDTHHTENNNENEQDNCEESNDQKHSIVSNDKDEDWDDCCPTSVVRQSELSSKGEATSAANLEDTTITSTNKIGDSITKNETNATVDSAAIESEYPKTDKPTDSKELEDITKLTVTIDSEGKRNISNEPTNNNIDSHPEKMVTDKNESVEEAAVSDKQDEIIEQPKPQRIHKKRQHRKEIKSSPSSQDQEKEDSTKEMLEKKEANSLQLESQGTTNTTDEQVESDSTTNSSSSSHNEKSKDGLPKLEIKKDENSEQVPDFLKTPQKKNWADCEFDEELDLPPLDLEWGKLAK